MRRLFVVVRADRPPVSADLGVRAQSLAVIESHLRVLGFELRPTLNNQSPSLVAHKVPPQPNRRRFTMSNYPNGDLQSPDLGRSR
jgi:hypothetical protein